MVTTNVCLRKKQGAGKVEKDNTMSEQISILVIEDDEHVRGILKYNLESDGFMVSLTEDGPEGLELAFREKPDVILLDWMMPEMDGLEVLTELRKDERTKNIPVFMLTAKDMPGDIGQAILEGINGYFTKPYDPAKLGPTLKRKLKKLVRN